MFNWKDGTNKQKIKIQKIKAGYGYLYHLTWNFCYPSSVNDFIHWDIIAVCVKFIHHWNVSHSRTVMPEIREKYKIL